MSKLLLCCTKNKRGYLHFDKREDTPRNKKYYLSPDSSPFDTYEPGNYLNGKIFAECDYEVEEIKHYIHHEPEVDVGVGILPAEDIDAYCTKSLDYFQLNKMSCSIVDDILNNKNGYAIHIKNLNTFDNARPLNYYWNKNKNECLKHSPSNMMKVSEIKQEEITIPFKTNPKEVNAIKINDYILVMVNPEEACDLLNGNRTVLVRKRVIKGMLVNE